LFPQSGYFMPKDKVDYFSIRDKSVTSYAVSLCDWFFKPEISIFCTCLGSSKGRSADGHPRARLPKEALNLFIGAFKKKKIIIMMEKLTI